MPRIPVRFQSASNDCGPACLAMIAAHFRRSVTTEEVARLCRLTRRGASLAQLADAAEQLGLRSLVARLPFQHLRRVTLPCVAHWRGKHFVVVERVTRRSVRIVDPMQGRLTLPAAEFIRQWAGDGRDEGAMLLVEPSHQFVRSGRGGLADLRFFWRYLRDHRMLLTQVLLSILVSSGLQLLIAFLARSLVDIGIASRNMGFIYLILGSQLVMFGARALNEFLRGWITLHIAARTNLSVLADFLKKLMRTSAGYFERKPVGDLLQRIGDHGRVQSFLTSSTITAVGATANLLFFGAALALFSLPITGVFAVATAALVGWMITFAGKRRQLDQDRFRQSATSQTALVQLIGGMRDIRLATCEREKRVAWEDLQARQFHINLSSLRLNQHMQGGAMAINELKNILISFIAAGEVIHGQMTLGTMLALSYMIGNLNGPVDQLVGLFQSGQDAKISVERIAEVHDAAEVEQTGTLPVPAALDLDIENVTFRYPGTHTDVLREISLSIPRGSRTAIVGPSGSGKTTLVKLLVRLYEPTEGAITVGGVGLSSIEMNDWRQRIGVVMQDGYIFSDTFARNIALGQQVIDDDRMRRVCRIARLDDLWPRLAEAFSTRIGANGHELSAGERQRVLIARALYKQPDIFIFDEATSALDGANEGVLLQNLEEELEGKTVITVAHRLSTVVSADRIVVLQDGRLAEDGTHADLVSSRRTYYQLIRNQLELGV